MTRPTFHLDTYQGVPSDGAPPDAVQQLELMRETRITNFMLLWEEIAREVWPDRRVYTFNRKAGAAASKTFGQWGKALDRLTSRGAHPRTFLRWALPWWRDTRGFTKPPMVQQVVTPAALDTWQGVGRFEVTEADWQRTMHGEIQRGNTLLFSLLRLPDVGPQGVSAVVKSVWRSLPPTWLALSPTFQGLCVEDSVAVPEGLAERLRDLRRLATPEMARQVAY